MIFFTEEKKTVIYKTPNRATEIDEITKNTSIVFLIVFIDRGNEEICSILFETIKKEYLFVENNSSFDTLETHDKIIKMKLLLDLMMLKFLLRLEQNLFTICFIKNMFLLTLSKTKEWKRQKLCKVTYLKKIQN